MKTDVIFVPDKIRERLPPFRGPVLRGPHALPRRLHRGPALPRPSQLDYHYEWSGEKAIVNVGSVGQPRDGDPRASCVIVEDRLVRFLRTDYDIATCQRKIYDNPNIPDLCAARLEIGK